MKQSTKRTLFMAMMASLLLLVACAPAQVATPDAAQIDSLVETSVALTVASQNLETAEAAPQAIDTPVPTATPVLVDTPTPILPTATPFVIVPPTTAPVSGGGSGVTTTNSSSCDYIRQRPYDNSIFKPGDKFDIKWTIVNSGTKTMPAGLDLKYNSGTKLTSTSFIELPQLKPGEEFAVIFDAVAPDKSGTYIMSFIVEGGLCYPAIQIIVEK